MELTFLGTAASEGYPVSFCGCDNCGRARALGGPNLRLRSAALIDGLLLVDLGPDVQAASLAYGIPLTGVHYALLTHEHEDHLDLSLLDSRSPKNGVQAPPLALHATPDALAKIAAANGHRLLASGALDPETERLFNITTCPVAAGETFHAGPYQVTAIPASHAPPLAALLYSIEREGRSLFYATDTGPLSAAAWETLAAWRRPFDVVVLDHTFGLQAPSANHNNAAQFLETVAQLRERGLLADGCRVYAHHLAHHSNPDHEALSAFAAERGYAVAHDGLTVSV